ncbi:MAG: hypothetical protein FJX77_12800 [Armatimonadetes bacterium]|nr:hypothetical protein [Armatimonadota bacterium]
MRLLCPAPPVNETRLLASAAAAFPAWELDDLTDAVLAQVTATHGVDFATALFYDRLRRSPRHGPVQRAIETSAPDLQALPRLSGSLLVAPAAAYREHPESGGDGALFREIAEEFGLPTAVASVGSGETVLRNAALLQSELTAYPERSVLLVSFSKGGADARIALRDPAARARVRLWIQVCGLVRGTWLADRIMDRPWLRIPVGLNFLLRGWKLEALEELRSRPGSLLSGSPDGPEGVETIHVIGCPLRCHVGQEARLRHARLARFGPNDGTALLRDQILEPGWVYPVWGADHYFHVPQLAPLIYQLFTWLALREAVPTAPETPDSGPAVPSPAAARCGGTPCHP